MVQNHSTSDSDKPFTLVVMVRRFCFKGFYNCYLNRFDYNNVTEITQQGDSQTFGTVQLTFCNKPRSRYNVEAVQFLVVWKFLNLLVFL